MTSPVKPPDHSQSRSPFKATHPPLTRPIARKLFPDSALEVIDPLATIWDEVVHCIIEEMMDLTCVDQEPLHINLREEMILELAQLQLWLGERVVEDRMMGRDPSNVDIKQEREECLGRQGADIISGTARMVYEYIWSKRLEERWKPKSKKAMERETTPRRTTLAVKPVNKNHFIPRWFIRDHWAIDGKVLRWQSGSEGWSSASRGFGKWGYGHKLYSDRLEAYFGLLEGDAKKPIQMLLETKPLNSPQRESFIGFLVIQILRNPAFMENLRQGLAPKLAELGYSNDPKMLQNVYDSLYGNNDLYHQLAHPVMWSRWALVETVSPLFVLPDTFGTSADIGDGLRLIVPLTPRICFVTLPTRESEKRIVPQRLSVDDHLARRISSTLIRSAAKEFLSHPRFQFDDRIEETSLADVLREIETTIGDREV